MEIKSVVDIPKALFKTIAIPGTPPVTTLYGEKNTLNENAKRKQPITKNK